MKLQVTERRLEENRRNQEEDIINHIATDKIRIVFLRKTLYEKWRFAI